MIYSLFEACAETGPTLQSTMLGWIHGLDVLQNRSSSADVTEGLRAVSAVRLDSMFPIRNTESNCEEV